MTWDYICARMTCDATMTSYHISAITYRTWQDHLRHVSVHFPILFYLFCAPTTPETKTDSVNNVRVSIKPKKKQHNNTYSLKYIFIIIHGIICTFFYYHLRIMKECLCQVWKGMFETLQKLNTTFSTHNCAQEIHIHTVSHLMQDSVLPWSTNLTMKLTISPSSPPKSSQSNRAPSSADIRSRSNGNFHKVLGSRLVRVFSTSIRVNPFSQWIISCAGWPCHKQPAQTVS